ncbi:hypothetical protein [Desulfosporosinus orientis]|nr:hypothetical protein [Desulfosporosinus orientis]
MIQVKVPKRFNGTLPVPVWVVKDFFRAAKNLAWVGEILLRRKPQSQDKKVHKHLNWTKGVTPRGLVEVVEIVINDLSKYKGLDLVRVEAGDVTVKISLK